MKMVKIPKTFSTGFTIMTGTSEVDIGGSGVTIAAPFDGCLLGIKVYAMRAGVPTAAESDTAVIRLKSNMVRIQPYEVFAQPTNAGIGADIQSFRAESPTYPVNCPVKKGDLIQATGAELTACTVHLYVGVTFIFADFMAAPQYNSQIGTQTATSASAATESAVNTITIGSGHSMIKRIYAMTVDTTTASGKGQICKYRITSDQIQKGGDIQFDGEGVGGVLSGAATGSCTMLTALEDVDIPISGQTILNGYELNVVAVTTAGKWNYCVMYV